MEHLPNSYANVNFEGLDPKIGYLTVGSSSNDRSGLLETIEVNSNLIDHQFE